MHILLKHTEDNSDCQQSARNTRGRTCLSTRDLTDIRSKHLTSGIIKVIVFSQPHGEQRHVIVPQKDLRILVYPHQ